MIKICPVCKKEFTTSHKNRKNCSRKCYAQTLIGKKPTVCFTSETAKKYGFQKGNRYGFKKGYTPWNKGKNFIARDLKGKTWEELYGAEKAEEMRRRKSNKNNPNWKGNKAGHHSFHTWVRTRLGTPQKCDFCGTTTAKFFDWANKSGEYKRELNDWLRLCRKCHRLFDLKRGKKNEILKRFGSKRGNYVKEKV